MAIKDSVTTIDLLRHGECEGGEIFRGTTDVELNNKGWLNMQSVVDHQQKEGFWDHVISSPLLRCRLFAEHLNKKYKLPLSIEDNFCEMDFGDWEGQKVQHIWAKDKEKVESIYSSPCTFQPPNGESMSRFKKRVTDSADMLIQESRGKHLLLIQHGGTMRILLTHLLSIPMSSMTRFHIPYACFSRVQFHHSGQTDHVNLIFHNIPC